MAITHVWGDGDAAKTATALYAYKSNPSATLHLTPAMYTSVVEPPESKPYTSTNSWHVVNGAHLQVDEDPTGWYNYDISYKPTASDDPEPGFTMSGCNLQGVGIQTTTCMLATGSLVVQQSISTKGSGGATGMEITHYWDVDTLSAVGGSVFPGNIPDTFTPDLRVQISTKSA